MASAAGLVPRLTSTQTHTKAKPNILFLFTDDQRFNTLGALNNPAIKTPNMDRLVRNGTVFTHAHIMGSMSGAVCMPSRAMLMTGRTLFHIQGKGEGIPEEHTMLPELLRANGYTTFGIGKWHNGPAAFNRAFASGAKIFFGGMSDHLHLPVSHYDPTGAYPKEERYPAEGFSSEVFSDAAIAFIEGQAGKGPFFAYVSYTAPHDPRMAPKAYADMYPPDAIELPENFMPEHPFDNGELRIRDEKLAPFPRTPDVVRQHIAAYYAMITHLDAQIGRVLDALDATGQADNTLIVFAGDNGLAVGQHGLLGKQSLYDHSVRVPLIFCGPGIPQGQVSDALCYLLDIFPTLCDRLGLAIPASVDGKSLYPLFADLKGCVRDSLFFAYCDVQRGVRTGEWKLLKYNVAGTKTTQMFNIKEDPWELRNLAGVSEYAQHEASTTALLRRWMADVDDPCTPAEWL